MEKCKKKGVLMCPAMAQAMAEGRKTETRRLPKKKILPLLEESERVSGKPEWEIMDGEIPPEYYPGQEIYVRERWRVVGWDEGGEFQIEYNDGSKHWFDCPESHWETKWETKWADWFEWIWEQCSDDCEKAKIPYLTDDGEPAGMEIEGHYSFTEEHPCPTRWRPNIFMPEFVARTRGIVASVGAERVQEITGQGVLAEGCNTHIHPQADYFECRQINMFRELWNSLHKTPGTTWEDNPIVWVYKFKDLKCLRT